MLATSRTRNIPARAPRRGHLVDPAIKRLAAGCLALLLTIIPATLAGAAIPTITSFSPASGPVGTVVTISGTGFIGGVAVSFNGVAASSFAFLSDTQVQATVPLGATTGPVSVVTPAGTAISPTNFSVTTGGSSCLGRLRDRPFGPSARDRRGFARIDAHRFRHLRRYVQGLEGPHLRGAPATLCTRAVRGPPSRSRPAPSTSWASRSPAAPAPISAPRTGASQEAGSSTISEARSSCSALA